tara:strand:- start:549 stop:896 length:348 start_codon:yes stop_codon:yes gene_type:complete
MIDTDRYKGLTNAGLWRGTDADDSVIFEVHDEHGEVVDFKTIALVQRDSDHYGNEDNPDIRLMVDAPRILWAYRDMREDAETSFKRAQRLWDLIEEHAPHLMTQATDAWNGDEEE